MRLTINTEKCWILRVSETASLNKVKIANESFDVVEEFKYLGVVNKNTGDDQEEVDGFNKRIV